MAAPSTREFPPKRDYSSLSIRDLLDAREAYHVYLSTLENVSATAIGRYLIHKDDWYASHSPNEKKPEGVTKPDEPRTLENSVIRPWSWPAVLVFVRRWQEPRQLGSNEVPRALYLPDGRVVPTCVILAEPDESLPPPAPGPSQTSAMFGGGYSCARKHQGITHFGTIGCLVSQQGTYFALTNRHVAGMGGEEVGAYVDGSYRRIGVCAEIASRAITIHQAFPAWPGDRTYLTLDAGLIRVDDISDWTSQAFGIGEIGEPFDATECTVMLDLIGCPVRAFGGMSGVIEGEIRALFFRYESLGGIDRATDLLIGPVTEPHDDSVPSTAPFTRPGDSGTLWFYDPPNHGSDESKLNDHAPPERGTRARRLRPVAMQWGGQRFNTTRPGHSSAFALASFISTVCRELDVDIVRDWSTGHDEYWGKIGHFAIGWKACAEVTGKLGKLMQTNQARIGFGNDVLGDGSEFRMGRDGFVPLADVPDYVWVMGRKNEPVQHFADIDIVDIEGGPSLLDRGVQDPASVSASVWKEYFDGFAGEEVGPEEGVLPFRVWQLWDAMVKFLKAKDVIRFFTAAGVLAHYVGDASQPLHCSYLHHGEPPMKKKHNRRYPFPRSSPEFEEFKKSREAKIHAIYEETMLEVDTPAALAAVDANLAQRQAQPVTIQSGHDAAVAILQLMHAAQQRLSPQTIIDADDASEGPKTRARGLWDNQEIRDATIESLADSVVLLAQLWQSAWTAGDGDSLPNSKLGEIAEQDLDDIYRKEFGFVKPLSLDELAASGKFEAS